MFRRMLLSLPLLLTACGSDAEEVADPRSLRVAVVSGDRQTAPVASRSQEPAGALIPAEIRAAAALDGLEILDQPFVARLDGLTQPQASLTGPSFARVPAGLDVAWIRPDDAVGCTRPFYAQTPPDDSGYVVNYGIKGTRAADCPILVGRIIEDSQTGQPTVVIDTQFVTTQTPGPVQDFFLASSDHVYSPGDSIDLRTTIASAYDAHLNPIPPETLAALPDSLVGWAWSDWVDAGSPIPTAPTDSGWIVVVPPLDGYEMHPEWGIYVLRLTVWIDPGVAGIVVKAR